MSYHRVCCRPEILIGGRLSTDFVNGTGGKYTFDACSGLSGGWTQPGGVAMFDAKYDATQVYDCFGDYFDLGAGRYWARYRCRSKEDGTVVWSFSDDTLQTLSGGGACVWPRNNYVWFCGQDPALGTGNSLVYKLNKSDGTEEWSTAIAGVLFYVDENEVSYFVDFLTSPTTIRPLDADGNPLTTWQWADDLTYRPSAGQISGDFYAWATSSAHGSTVRVKRYTSTGTLVWTSSIVTGSPFQILETNNYVYITDTSGNNGRMVWLNESDGVKVDHWDITGNSATNPNAFSPGSSEHIYAARLFDNANPDSWRLNIATESVTWDEDSVVSGINTYYMTYFRSQTY